ncbi:MAG: SMP-30/gluconolactonase/LRE family protein [Prolixibacteraceae bacterium]|jgi:gluconolactonase|nr:SMP-30/gluconolactonase/LRE family protein [Prolixibacteraceae bacterium]
MEFQTIISGLNFPEGPVFDFDGNLWFVEIKGGNLSRWDGTKLVRFDVDGIPNGAMMDGQGHVWFCDSGRGEIRLFEPHLHTFKTICDKTTDGIRLKRPNDLIFDIAGNLLFSDHADGREKPLSTICVLPEGSDQARIISRNKYFTNGLAFRADAKTLFFSETYRQQLWVAEWDATKLELRNESLFAKAGDGPWGPDGIAFDQQENLFATIFNESKINIYNKEGQLTDSISCPGNRPTNCAFDPSGRLGLIVTEAERGEIISYPGFGKGLPIYYG